MAGLITPVMEKLIPQLLIVDSLRGSDSTGIAVVNSQGTVNVAKQVGNPFELMDTNSYSAALKGIPRVVIGHNRFATQGKVNKRNAHPFDFDNVVGAHNGTLTNRVRLDGTFDVDSEQIYHHIDKFGLKDCLSKMQGAWALVWYDKKESTINFLRNKERTFYFVFTEDNNTILWASEYWMLTSILWRNNIKHKEVQSLAEDIHLSIKVDVKTGSLEKPHASQAPCTFTYQAVSYFPKPVVQQPAKTPVKVEKKREPIGGQKSCKYVCGSVKKDFNGTRYIPLYEVGDMESETNVRWYFHSIDPDEFVGEEITADVYDIPIQAKGERWYRVNPHSVQLVGESNPIAGKYKCDCDWCSNPIFEGEPHGKLEESYGTPGFICKNCVSDPEVKSFFKFKEVV